MSLHQAPAHVVLAVDLIELLENNQLDPKVVLAALPLIEQDYRRKLAHAPVTGVTQLKND